MICLVLLVICAYYIIVTIIIVTIIKTCELVYIELAEEGFDADTGEESWQHFHSKRITVVYMKRRS